MEKKIYEKPEMEVVELEDAAIETIVESGESCESKYSSPDLNVSC